jgi:hypothetical protein
MNRLREMTYLPRHLPAFPLSLAAAADRDRAGFWPTKAGDDVEQGALSRAVDSEQREKLALFAKKANGIEHGSASIREAHILDFKQAVQSEPPMPWMKSKSRCVAIGVRGPGTTRESVVPA